MPHPIHRVTRFDTTDPPQPLGSGDLTSSRIQNPRVLAAGGTIWILGQDAMGNTAANPLDAGLAPSGLVLQVLPRTAVFRSAAVRPEDGNLYVLGEFTGDLTVLDGGVFTATTRALVVERFNLQKNLVWWTVIQDRAALSANGIAYAPADAGTPQLIVVGSCERSSVTALCPVGQGNGNSFVISLVP